MTQAKKKMVGICMALILVLSFSITALAAGARVEISDGEYEKSSSSTYGTWKFIDNTTSNSYSSRSSMRAVFQIKTTLISSYYDDPGRSVLVGVGENAPYYESNRYSNPLYFRLTLRAPYYSVNGIGFIYLA